MMVQVLTIENDVRSSNLLYSFCNPHTWILMSAWMHVNLLHKFEETLYLFGCDSCEL